MRLANEMDKGVVRISTKAKPNEIVGLDFEEVDYCRNKLNNGKGSTWTTNQVNLERFLKKFKRKSISLELKGFAVRTIRVR